LLIRHSGARASRTRNPAFGADGKAAWIPGSGLRPAPE
jgi:hypothetical protein